MTPKQLVDLVQFAIEWGVPALDAWRDAERPKPAQGGLASLVDEAFARRIAEAAAKRPAMTQQPDGTWRVDGLDLALRTSEEAQIAAEVVGRVRAAER